MTGCDAKDIKPLSRQTVGKSAAIKNRLRRKAVARYLAMGMKPEKALLEAGYSSTTARKKAYLVIRHPEVQSLLTESVERVLAEEKKQFVDIVRPYVKALGACVVVKSTQLGVASETTIPDHSIRMEAANQLTKLYQPRNAEDHEEEAGESGLPVVLQINFIKSPLDKDAKPFGLPLSNSRQVLPEKKDVSVPQVSFVQSKRWP